MNAAVRSLLAAGALVCLAGGAMAAGGDIPRGARIATRGVNGLPACNACHGAQGIGDGWGGVPRLAGQVAFYLYKQLTDFAAGTRESAIMQSVAKRLSDADRQAVAAYFASLKAPYYPVPVLGETVLQRGGKIAAAGLASRGVPACFSCHGLQAAGNAPLYPYLGGQYGEYLYYQLRQFKSGARRNDGLAVMRDIAAKLSPAEMAAVSFYLESVRPVPYRTIERGGNTVAGGGGPADPVRRP